MKRVLPIMVVLLTLVLGCQRGQNMLSGFLATEKQEPVIHSLADGNPQQEADAQWQTPYSQKKQQAVITDNRSGYRLCNTRPQRILLSHLAKDERTQGKFSSVDPTHLFTKHHFDGRRRTETAPFRFFVSRDYYVIALRHILR